MQLSFAGMQCRSEGLDFVPWMCITSVTLKDLVASRHCRISRASQQHVHAPFLLCLDLLVHGRTGWRVMQCCNVVMFVFNAGMHLTMHLMSSVQV